MELGRCIAQPCHSLLIEYCTYLDHAEVAVEEAPVLRVLAALDVVGHGQEDVAGGSVVKV